MSEPKSLSAVSVAMATYQGATYLREQLDSIARQTLLPRELVVTDDGSTDATLEIVEDFARSAPFAVRIFRNENRLGYASNFIRAASLCTGDLIACCDQDDVWLENKLARCIPAFADPDTLLCVHSGELWDGHHRSTRRVPEYRTERTFPALSLYPLQGSFGFAMILRAELLSIANNESRCCPSATSPSLAHDQWFWFLASIFGKVALLPDALVLYRQHGANVFGGTAPRTGAVLAGGAKLRDYLGRAPIEDSATSFLTELAAHCAPKWAMRARVGAAFMARCAQSNRLRAKIYQSAFRSRFSAFVRMCSSRGYSDAALRYVGIGRPPSRSLWQAPVKDLCLGVLGGSRFSGFLSRSLSRLRRK